MKNHIKPTLFVLFIMLSAALSFTACKTEVQGPDTGTITFNANGGTGENSTQTIALGATEKLNANAFTREGYVFDGWNTAADGSGTAYADEADFTMTETSGITLYAQWLGNAAYIARQITSMTEDGTIVAHGRLGNDDIPVIAEAIKDCQHLVNLDLSNVAGLTEIISNAFESCNHLSGIVLPDGVTTIGDSAFQLCESLASVTIPENVTTIGEYAFCECSSLTSITIPNSVTTIGDSAFENCKGLTSITIPNNVTAIGNSVFSGCRCLTSVTIPNSVTTIGDFAFYKCNKLTSVTIPNSVTTIATEAFADCRSLTSITIPSNVAIIGEGVFDQCRGLTSVIIQNGVTAIGDWVFNDCTKITSITIPSSVIDIGSYAFNGCKNLTSVEFADTDEWYATTNSSYTGGNNITVTNPSQNAINMKDDHGVWWNKYLYKSTGSSGDGD